MRPLTGFRAALPIILGLAAAVAAGQLTTQEAAEDARQEEFLRTAAIVGETQMGGPNAITEPWKLTLEKDGRRTFGLWKFIDSRKGGVPDRWRFEIAAYRFDRMLGLNMVPVTIERPFKDKPGSLQIWMEGTETLKVVGPKIERPDPRPIDGMEPLRICPARLRRPPRQRGPERQQHPGHGGHADDPGRPFPGLPDRPGLHSESHLRPGGADERA